MRLHFRVFVTTSIILLICFAPFIADAQMFDGSREGLIFGGGVGFAAVASGDYGSATGFTTSGKIGYGISDQLAIYVSSSVLSFYPSARSTYFPGLNSDYFVQGALGYTSGDEDSILSIAGGGGYELQDHGCVKFLSLLMKRGMPKDECAYGIHHDSYR